MNRFEFDNFTLLESESVVLQTKYIRLYDGSEKVFVSSSCKISSSLIIF